MDSQEDTTAPAGAARAYEPCLGDLIREAHLHAIVARTIVEGEIEMNPKEAGYTYPLTREQMEIIHFAANNTETALIRIAEKARAS